ncbi:ubiquitin-related domain-containing protein [Gaertneriomyces semiglobifer]|nr:ubiquitin-related domain-containing protein [Gaertneriomyces semiglobifer]
MPSDRETLLDMGFSSAKVTIALHKTSNSGLQPAMDWLFAHAEDPEPTEEEVAKIVSNQGSTLGGSTGDAANTGEPSDEGEISAEQATAQSLKCDDCGKIFRDSNGAQLHAMRSQHQNFSESTDIIKPLTAEEKAAKLVELQARLTQRREEKRKQEEEERKKQEKVRRVTGKEMTQLKEKIKEQEMQKALEAKKKEKEEEKRAREKIKAQIEADKKERARKRCSLQAEERKHGVSNQQSLPTSPTVATPAPSVGAATYTQSRLQIRDPTLPPITQSFPIATPLSEVYSFVSSKINKPVGTFKLAMTFPRKLLESGPETLESVGLVPSGVLVVQ